jgi:hypothetical protein
MTFAIIGRECAPGIFDGRPVVVPGAVSSNTTEADFLSVLVQHRRNLGTRLGFHHVPGRLRLRADAL